MIKQKEVYTSPLTEVLVVRFEGVVCGSPNGYTEGGAGFYGTGDVFDNGDF